MICYLKGYKIQHLCHMVDTLQVPPRSIADQARTIRIPVHG